MPFSKSAAKGRGDARPVSIRSRAIALLARREYGRAELKKRLLTRASDAEARDANTAAVDAVLDELAAEGLLSDERYARSVVLRKAHGYSARAIADTLKSQGLPEESVHQALAERALDDDAVMRALWERRFGDPPRDERDKARQVRFLQSRGFSLSAILRFLRSVAAAD